MDLTDNDDFDSFFNTKTHKLSTQQKSSKPLDSMEDLFGIEEKSDGRTPTTRKAFTAGTKSTISQKGIREEEEDDDLGFDPKKPKALGKSLTLFDDLLSPLETKMSHTSASSNVKATISRQSTETTTDNSNIFQTQAVRTKTSQGRRASNMSSVQNPDPLGLFIKDKETSKSTSLAASPKTQSKAASADWLGLSKEIENENPKADINLEIAKTTNLTKTPANETTAPVKLSEINERSVETEIEVHHQEERKNEILAQENEQAKIDSTSKNFMLMNTFNLETQHNLSTLKYQEQQLMMASQMKQQEQVLIDMQRKQDALLQQQESQFRKLFEQQMHRHQQLEDLIKHQQHRINNHLHLLMTQPPLLQNLHEINIEKSLPANRINTEQGVATEIPLENVERQKQTSVELLQYESDNKRLELENIRLEELVANSKSNYEREIELLERSYKKQIEVLEGHLSSVETRLKSELNDLQIYFRNKIEMLEQEKNTLKKNYEEELSNLKQDHEDDIRKLRKNQEEDLEILKEEHHRILDNIRQAKMLEFAAVQDNGSYLDYLKVASNNLQDLSGGLKELKENMQSKIEILHLEKEKNLEHREKIIEDSERRLKMMEESTELEKERLMNLVSSLELQVAKMSKDSAEESWQLKQKLASIDAEKMAFKKEQEYIREQMLRDEERIKDLKEQQLLETQKLQAQLQEERAQLQVEKSKFDLEKRLQNNTDIEKERMEVEAAMQVAQDAARKADLEKERFYKMQRQLEQHKRELSDKEHVLNVREDELHQELLSYRMAEKAAQELQQKAKIAEQFYQNKLQLLQERCNEITEKETNLSQERLLLAQDRIALHALKTKFLQQPKCSLCQLSQKNQEISQSLHAPNGNNAIKSKDFSNSLRNYDFLSQTNIVERLLDANIEDSMRKMLSNSNFASEWENLLDDDHKKMVQNDEYDISNPKNLAKTNM